MSVNIKNSPTWKYGVGKMWPRALGMALLLVVLMAGCGGTAKPTLTSIAPSSGVQGAAVTVTLMGTNFMAGSTISLSSTGITVSNLMVASNTSITATFTIAANAPIGAQNVTVMSASKTSGSQMFTVNSGAPTLSTVSPSSGLQGQGVPVTLTGTLFASGATIGLSGTGITVSNTTVVSSTSITATFTVALNAPTGGQTVTVTTPIGTSGTQTFTVNLLPPTVTSTNPANLATGVPINRKIAATFSKPMNPLTITAATFTVVGGGTNVAGTVTCNAACNVATFAPMANLAANITFTATITTSAKDPAGNSLASPFVWTFTTSAATDTTAPTVISTNPANAATGVALNQKIAATFSEVMDASTITTTTFTLKQGTTAVAGTVSYAGTTATFTPTANLTASTVYTATITIGAKDLAGNSLASNFVWTFTTGTTSNTSAPTVTLTVPADKATAVGINQTINATFSAGMDPATINTGTLTVTGPGTTNVTGVVTYNSTSMVATFTPTANLAASALFTATVTTGAKDLAGNALAAGAVPNPWTFTTGATTTGQGQVNLGSASTFAIMATASISSTGSVVVNGDVGLAPGTSQGIPPAQVNGTIHVNDPVVTQAKVDLLAAYNDLVSRSTNAQTLPGNVGGLTFAPGLYVNSTSVLLSGSGPGNNVTLDAQGDANAVFIFKMGSTLTTAPGSQVILAGGAKAGNIFWLVGSSATIDTTTIFKGNVLAAVSITLNTGVAVEGRMFAGAAGGAGSATVNASTVTVPSP
jgi:Ice-binding-like/Bacterial Ig-like domain/Quinohemoprotein amine dehydrogenase, alpha subunit domain III